MKLAKNGPENISSVKVGVHHFSCFREFKMVMFPCYKDDDVRSTVSSFTKMKKRSHRLGQTVLNEKKSFRYAIKHTNIPYCSGEGKIRHLLNNNSSQEIITKFKLMPYCVLAFSILAANVDCFRFKYTFVHHYGIYRTLCVYHRWLYIHVYCTY